MYLVELVRKYRLEHVQTLGKYDFLQHCAMDDRLEDFPPVRRANIWRAARPQLNPKRPFNEQKTFPTNGRNVG
jgi:hypothetical protein